MAEFSEHRQREMLAGKPPKGHKQSREQVELIMHMLRTGEVDAKSLNLREKQEVIAMGRRLFEKGLEACLLHVEDLKRLRFDDRHPKFVTNDNVSTQRYLEELAQAMNMASTAMCGYMNACNLGQALDPRERQLREVKEAMLETYQEVRELKKEVDESGLLAKPVIVIDPTSSQSDEAPTTPAGSESLALHPTLPHGSSRPEPQTPPDEDR